MNAGSTTRAGQEAAWARMASAGRGRSPGSQGGTRRTSRGACSGAARARPLPRRAEAGRAWPRRSRALVQIQSRTPQPPLSTPAPHTPGHQLRGLQRGGRGRGAAERQTSHRAAAPPPRRRAPAAVERAAQSRRVGPAARTSPGCERGLASSAPAAHLRAPLVTGSPHVRRSVAACWMWAIVSGNEKGHGAALSSGGPAAAAAREPRVRSPTAQPGSWPAARGLRAGRGSPRGVGTEGACVKPRA